MSSINHYVYAKYGVNRGDISHILLNIFNINDECRICYQKAIKEMYLLKWETAFLSKKIKFNRTLGNIISRNGINYKVVYYKTNSTDISKYKKCLLSFRELHEDVGLPPVVLIKPYRD